MSSDKSDSFLMFISGVATGVGLRPFAMVRSSLDTPSVRSVVPRQDRFRRR